MGTARRFVALLLTGSPTRARWRFYIRSTWRPLHALVFLLPWVLLYEVAAGQMMGGATGTLLAHTLVNRVLAWVGLVGAWLPAAVLVAVLLCEHIVRGDRWQVRWWALPWMLLESALLAVPLLVWSALLGPGSESSLTVWSARLVQGLGAALYEEFVFRLLLLTFLAWLLLQVVGLPRQVALIGAVGLGALVFAWCHFDPIGVDVFTWRAFWFRLVAGVYFGWLYAVRGLGIAAGAHAVYNALVVTMWVPGG